ncbi:MAG: glycosyltransferase [Nitrospinota bacterium]|nr:MAG: glycosyltransferase [Nitrospinota bacterium]
MIEILEMPVETLFLFIHDLLDRGGALIDRLLPLWPDRFARMFWAFIFLEVPRYLLTDFYVLFQVLLRRERRPLDAELTDFPLVSVILPALNEEQTIAYTIRSLLHQDYPNLEIIVVDDGSTDQTPEICQNFANQGLIRFFRLQTRQGKSAALNHGLKAARGEFIVFMDTDSTLDRHAIRNLIPYFADERIGAVSGTLRVRNPHVNLLTKLQTIEYLISIMVGRYFRGAMGILSIVPGAFGAFRRDLLARIGGHEPGPGNDSDLTIRTRKLRKQVAFAPTAICLTNVPHNLRRLIKQRMRWNRNIIRNRLRKHKDTYNIFLAHFSLSNLVSFVDTIFFAVFLSLVWLVYFIDIILHYPNWYTKILLINYFLHLSAKLLQFLIALIISERKGEYISLVFYLPLFELYRMLFLKLIRIAALLQELFFRWSYRDPFAPEKVRNQIEVY